MPLEQVARRMDLQSVLHATQVIIYQAQLANRTNVHVPTEPLRSDPTIQLLPGKSSALQMALISVKIVTRVIMSLVIDVT